MLQNILSNWNVFRFLRLAGGSAIAGAGFMNGDYAIASLGGLYGLMAVLNIGCAHGTACATQAKQRGRNDGQVTFEEIK